MNSRFGMMKAINQIKSCKIPVRCLIGRSPMSVSPIIATDGALLRESSKSQQDILEDQHQVPYKVNVRIKEIKNILLLSYSDF